MRNLLANCLLLLIPVLLFNLLFFQHLPAAYQAPVWDDVPLPVTMAENLLRLLVLGLLPLFMSLRIDTPPQRLGLALYLIGVVIYTLSWTAQIRWPDSTWSTSAAGFLAPTYTPALLLVGIGLIGTRLTISAVPYRPWVFFCPAASFLAIHIAHGTIVYLRHRP